MRRSVVVINCSKRDYNLGARKCADWLRSQGDEVIYYDGDPGPLWTAHADLVCLSIIFSWDAPTARNIALRTKQHAEVWAGGPGLFALRKWWSDQTGLTMVKGLDDRFERQRGDYRYCFASRGCPVACPWCIVPVLEGTSFSYDPEFVPAPILCDNNLSALPIEYQKHIIERYRAFGVRLTDANSGYEPRTFSDEVFRLWQPVLKGPWRFAFDAMNEAEYVERMMRILRDVPSYRKRVYVLVGNEPVEVCYQRAMQVIAWKGEPYCQYLKPLNWLGENDALDKRARHDWTYRLGRDFCRYFNGFVWRQAPIHEYKPRKYEPPPFAHLQPTLYSTLAPHVLSSSL